MLAVRDRLEKLFFHFRSIMNLAVRDGHIVGLSSALDGVRGVLTTLRGEPSKLDVCKI